MINVASYHQNAEDCVHQAGLEETPEDKNILLNVALAWLRLAQQTQALAHARIRPRTRQRTRPSRPHTTRWWPSAADLKFLHHLRQSLFRNFKSKAALES